MSYAENRTRLNELLSEAIDEDNLFQLLTIIAALTDSDLGIARDRIERLKSNIVKFAYQVITDPELKMAVEDYV